MIAGVAQILPSEDAQVQYVYDRQVASPVITVITVPFHAQQLNCCPRYKEAESEARPLRLLIPKVKPYTVEH